MKALKLTFVIASIAIALVWGVGGGTQEQEQTLENLVGAIQKKYQGVNSLIAHFSQKNFVASLNQFREFQGTITLKRPHLFLMEVTSPSTQQLVFDGSFYWVYTQASHQALKNPVPPGFAQHPLINLINTMANLDQDFIVSQGISHSADEYSLTLTLRTPQSDIESAHLAVGKKDFQIRELLLRYSSGNYTQFFLTELKENLDVPLARFRFEPPPGVEVVENPAPAAERP